MNGKMKGYEINIKGKGTLGYDKNGSCTRLKIQN